MGIVTQLGAGKGNRLDEDPGIFAPFDGFEHQPERLAGLGAAPDKHHREAVRGTPPEAR